MNLNLNFLFTKCDGITKVSHFLSGGVCTRCGKEYYGSGVWITTPCGDGCGSGDGAGYGNGHGCESGDGFGVQGGGHGSGNLGHGFGFGSGDCSGHGIFGIDDTVECGTPEAIILEVHEE